MKRGLSIAALSWLVGANAAFSAGCDEILTQTRDIDVSISSVRLAESLFKSECSGSQLKSNWSANAGIDAVIESIPIGLKLGGGSSKEKIEHLCKTYDSWSQQNTDSLNILIATKIPAIEAWETCKKLELSGIFFSFNPVRESVGFSVRRGSTIFEFLGATYDKNEMTCVGPFGTSGESVVIDDKTRFELRDPVEYPFVCTRTAMTDSAGNTFFPETIVTVSAMGGPPLAVPLDRLDVSGGLYLQEVQADLSSAVSRIDTLERTSVSDRFNAMFNDAGNVIVQGVCFRPRVLVRCYYERPGEYNHLTWFENEAECKKAGFKVEGSEVILGKC